MSSSMSRQRSPPTCGGSHESVILDTATTGSRRDRLTVTQAAARLDPGGRPQYVEGITAHRWAKDTYLRTAADSPLRRPGAEVRALTYFPVDDRYRITVPRLRRPASGDRPLALDTSDGLRRIARRLALLDFDLDGQRMTLTAFGFGPTDRGTLFVPFADATSGTETYSGGRYLDLEIEPDGSVVLDFNLAYHPYCVYSGAYSCPLTPGENRLPVPIVAGERLPT